MKQTVHLSLEELLHIHTRMLARDGGSDGVRDAGLLEAALARARSGYYETLAEQAAALLQSLATGHPFVDGNKRVAFAACATFLRVNGYRLVLTADDGEAFIIDEVIAQHRDVQGIAAWLEARMSNES